MLKILKKTIDVIFWIVMGAAVLLLFLFGGVRLFGYTPYVVTSGSMIPVYPVGTIVYVREAAPKELKVGDDISFYMDEEVVATHRIGEIHKEKGCVTTYGVNNIDSEGNQINDAKAVDFDHIIGRVEFSIPIVGYVYMFIRTTSGKAGVMIIIFGLFAVSQILQYLEKEKKR
jgi:signal peptidase